MVEGATQRWLRLLRVLPGQERYARTKSNIMGGRDGVASLNFAKHLDLDRDIERQFGQSHG